MNNTSLSVYIKMALYTLVTAAATFFSLLDASKAISFDQLTSMDWFKIVGQSILPSLISLKAFLDPSANNKPEADKK